MTRAGRFLARRVAAGIFTVLLLVALTFLIYRAVPSMPASFLYPNVQHINDYQVQHANHLFGLDRPLSVQYADYVWHLAQGDVGRFWSGSQIVDNARLEQQPIGPTLFAGMRVTLSIIIGGALIVVLIAVPLGLASGARINTWVDWLISFGALIAVCLHPRVLSLMLIRWIAPKGWVPVAGYCPLVKGAHDSCGGPGAWASHLLLAWVTFALLFLALYIRIIRAGVATALHEDYVRTARSKGAGEPRVLGRHVLPSVGLSVLTMVGMEVSTAIGICIYIETSFNFNGLGRMALQAMGGAESTVDLPFTLAIVTMITLFVVIGNLIVDLLYSVLDPRAAVEPRRERVKAAAGGLI